MRDPHKLTLILTDLARLNDSIDLEVLLIVDQKASLDSLTIPLNAGGVVRVVASRESGPGKLRNLGLDLARGDYVSFFDDDDRVLFEPGSHAFRGDVVLFQFNHPSEVFSNSRLLAFLDADNITTSIDILNLAIEVNFIFSYCQPFAIKLSTIRALQLNFTDSMVMEDLDFVTHLFSHVLDVSTVSNITYQYIFNSGSTKSMSGLAIYESAQHICSRLTDLAVDRPEIVYLEVAKKYARDISRFRFIEALPREATDILVCTEIAIPSFGLRSHEADLFFWRNLFKIWFRDQASLVALFCYNNCSVKLAEILKKQGHRPLIFDERADALIASGVQGVRRPEQVWPSGQGPHFKFVAHAHPGVLKKYLTEHPGGITGGE